MESESFSNEENISIRRTKQKANDPKKEQYYDTHFLETFSFTGSDKIKSIISITLSYYS